MKKHVLFILIAAFAVGCTVSELGNDVLIVDAGQIVYTAGIESVDSKVYVDPGLQTHWTAGDEIAIFKTTAKQRYRFDGQTGDREGTFSFVNQSSSSGSDIPALYAVYPYDDRTTISTYGYITHTLPNIQFYAENSFGLGANTMVAMEESKESTNFKFKSVSSYIVVQLYGEGKVKSITLTANGGEALAGVAFYNFIDGMPQGMIYGSESSSIVLDCGDGVEVGKTAGEATPFWFVVPFINLSKGFTITVTSTDLKTMVKSSSKSRYLKRNTKYTIAPLELDFTEALGQYVAFDDDNFKAYCLGRFDTNRDGEISFEEAGAVTSIQVNTNNISSLGGIEHFVNLTELACSGTSTYSGGEYGHYSNGLLTNLDVSKNTALTCLDCCNNGLTSLDLSNNTKLQYLYCDSNFIQALDLSKNVLLRKIACDKNLLTAIDVSNSVDLTALSISDNRLISLDVTKNEALETLRCDNNQLQALPLNNNTQLKALYCSQNQLTRINTHNNTQLLQIACRQNQISSLDLSDNPSLSYLDCCDNVIESLLLGNNTSLTAIYCSDNKLSSLNVSNAVQLSYLSCYHNQITSLNLDNNINLLYLICYGNQLSALDVSHCLSLNQLHCNNNQIAVLDVSANADLAYFFCGANPLSSIDVSNNPALVSLNCQNSPSLTVIWLQWGQSITTLAYDTNVATIKYRGIVYFEDANFKSYCVNAFDKNHDGEISTEEAQNVKKINVSTDNIRSLKGIESFPSLTSFTCSGSGETYDYVENEEIGKGLLTTIDLSKNTELVSLYCSQNRLTSLNLNGCTKLQVLHCWFNKLTTLDVSAMNSLEELSCHKNKLSSLDVSNCSEIRYLSCSENQLTSFLLSPSITLTELYCHTNKLPTIDVSKNTALQYFECYSNLLTTLDVSNNKDLKLLWCYYNPNLTEIWLKKNQTIEDFKYDTEDAHIRYKD